MEAPLHFKIHRVRFYVVKLDFTWRMWVEYLRIFPILQTASNCWAVAFTRQLEGRLKLSRWLRLEFTLSIQELMNIVSRNDLSSDGSGCMMNGPSVVNTFNRVGTVLDNVCPFTQEVVQFTVRSDAAHQRFRPRASVLVSRYEYVEHNLLAGRSQFYTDLEEDLLVGPVSIRFPIFPSYVKAEQTGVYIPAYDEVMRVKENYRRNRKPIPAHYALVVGSGRLNGVPVYEVQESRGNQWGHSGYIYVARYIVEHYLRLWI